MKKLSPGKSPTAFALCELLVLVLAIEVFTLAVLVPFHHRPRRSSRLKCMNNLKQVGIAFRLFATDNNDSYPMRLSTNSGGSKEYLGLAGETFRHFQVMSNELATPQILICPQDKRSAATNFLGMGNLNLSFFVGLDADESRPAMFLGGDRTITNGTKPRNGVLFLRTNQTTGWTLATHVGDKSSPGGNVLLADGSVQAVNNTRLRVLLGRTGDSTNRIALP